ncbi:MAG: CRTAC1 family protein, partial [Thermoanaerobaculia bacterium]|nr:CRTAC1 family protein [Thermoanaerobaculia bacterium]
DYDLDGDDDLFFVDGGELPGYEGEPARSRLLRNDGPGRFVDVTETSGLAVAAYGSGATAGDADGDGDLDLYVTALGPNQLFRNEGDGRFTDVTAEAGVGDELWGASAAFADVDRDGDLDLYLANYIDFTLERHRECIDGAKDLPVYCHPSTYPGQPDRFFRNEGGGRFREAAVAAGLLAGESMAGLGVVFGDLDDDGDPDLYVANDTEPNFLFVNRGDGTYEETSFLAGVAVSERGMVEAGMGVDLGDVDGDGRLDIVVTNFEMETNALYRNLGSGLFADQRYPLNVAEPSLVYLAFGVVFGDYDHDGDLDLAIANGHVRDNAEKFYEWSTYPQRNQLFENRGGRFVELTAAGFERMAVSRGMAAGDLDLDLDLDLVVVNSNDTAEAYENLGGSSSGAALVVDLAGRVNRFGVGARLTATAGGRDQVREVKTGSSYLSQNGMGVHFGLGAAPLERLEVRWPEGARQRVLSPPAPARLKIVEPR